MAHTRHRISWLFVVAVLYFGVESHGQTPGWTDVSPGPSDRGLTAMAYDSARARLVLFGGYVSGGIFGSAGLGDTWEWDGTAWALASNTGPTPRLGHAMVFDSARGRTVLFGGYYYDGMSHYLGDTWEWDGASWTQVATSGPEPRYGHAMVYDSGRGRTVLFGGSSSSTLALDTWEWDGSTWTQIVLAGPTARTRTAMAYDSARARTVLFGGYLSNGSSSGTWEYDGTSWTQRSSSGPGARGGHSMAYDPVHHRVVLFGGANENFMPSASLSDTWEWDGTSWVRRSTGGIGPRTSPAMAFDTAHGHVVVFGGYYYSNDGWIGSFTYRDTWYWDGNRWTSIAPQPRFWHSMAYDS